MSRRYLVRHENDCFVPMPVPMFRIIDRGGLLYIAKIYTVIIKIAADAPRRYIFSWDAEYSAVS